MNLGLFDARPLLRLLLVVYPESLVALADCLLEVKLVMGSEARPDEYDNQPTYARSNKFPAF